jgi:RimK family alpha-L-glutamate ligase
MYSTTRMQTAAVAMDVRLNVCEMSDISFVVDDETLGIFCNKINLIETNDVLVVRTSHPYVSEVLTLARLFHDAGKLVIDQSIGDEGYAISKMHDYLILAQNQINVPRTWQIYDRENVQAVASAIGYPCILKGVHGAHGSHVYLVENETQLRYHLDQYSPGQLCVQEYLRASEDYRVLVIGYEALPQLVSRRPYEGEFVTNSAATASFTARSIEEFPELRTMAERGARVLRREFAGVDIRYRDNEPMILEVNRRPTFEGFEMVTSIDVATTFLHYVQKRFREYSSGGRMTQGTAS